MGEVIGFESHPDTLHGECSKKLYRHTVEMQQMMECLLAKMDANQAKMDANLSKMRDKMLEKLHAHHERLMARMNFQLEKMGGLSRKDGTTDLEANPEEIESEAVHEGPKEEVAVETFSALEEWHVDWHLAIRHHGQKKKKAQGR
jgi:hypothetical protein